jgi:hypothetical protein
MLAVREEGGGAEHDPSKPSSNDSRVHLTVLPNRALVAGVYEVTPRFIREVRGLGQCQQ